MSIYSRQGHFKLFVSLFQKITTEQGFKDAIVGMEPTGHYWLNLAPYLIFSEASMPN
ncbi:hypothetical protein [Paenibacillus sp. sgz302251]|uniref:hypothetical protein n=1 Tax=Paenibacillus sp. sgz302251 TaxID=3414493 RepID=UPI003C7D8B6E